MSPFLALSVLAATHGPRGSPVHDLEYAVAKAVFHVDGSYEIAVAFHIAALVLETEPGHLSLGAWANLREMAERELRTRVTQAHAQFSDRLRIHFDVPTATAPVISFPRADLIREDGLALDPKRAPPVVIRGQVPTGARTFTIVFPYQIGAVLLTVAAGDSLAAGELLRPGRASPSLPVAVVGHVTVSPGRGGSKRIGHYLLLGFEHILPRGVDHILFVLSLFLLSTRFRTLAWQVTAFTIAHSVALALAARGVVSLSPAIVEPLISLSIVVVAAENLITTRLHAWRPVIVFGFGLLHGLGFAGVFESLPLSPSETIPAVAGFNLGVEGGQLAIIVLALAATATVRSRPWYRGRVAVPASGAIALAGLYWTLSRVVLGA